MENNTEKKTFKGSTADPEYITKLWEFINENKTKLAHNEDAKRKIRESMYKVPVKNYTSNFLYQSRFFSIMDIFPDTFNRENLFETTKNQITELKEIEQLYEYLFGWSKLIENKKIQELARKNKGAMIQSIKKATDRSKNDYYAKLKKLVYIATLLNWTNELEKMIMKLTKGLLQFTASYECKSCHHKGMTLYQDTIICPECGFAYEL